jgi:hypothetical protein
MPPMLLFEIGARDVTQHMQTAYSQHILVVYHAESGEHRTLQENINA